MIIGFLRGNMINKSTMKSLKTLFTALLFTSFAFSGLAQADGEDCNYHKSNYLLRVKSEKYVEAYKFYSKFIKCTELKLENDAVDVNDYIFGTYIFEAMMNAEADEARKKELKDSTYMLYDIVVEKSPEPAYKLAYAYFILTNDPGVIDLDAKADSLFMKFEKAGGKMDCSTIQYQWINKYNMMRNEEITTEDLIDAYFEAVEKFEKVTDEDCTAAKDYVDQYASPFLSCDKLNEMIVAQISELPEACDAKMEKVQKWLDLLNGKNCTATDAYKQLAAISYDCNPSYDAAMALFNSNWAEKDFAAADKYLSEALSLAGDQSCETKYEAARYYYAKGAYSQAMSYAEASTGCNREAYEIMAKIVVKNSTCGSTSIARKSVFWLASDYMEKAGKGADYYKKNYPSRTDLFSDALNIGSSYTVPCYGKTTTIRAKD
jgi:hypothetical protein